MVKPCLLKSVTLTILNSNLIALYFERCTILWWYLIKEPLSCESVISFVHFYGILGLFASFLLQLASASVICNK